MFMSRVVSSYNFPCLHISEMELITRWQLKYILKIFTPKIGDAIQFDDFKRVEKTTKLDYYVYFGIEFTGNYLYNQTTKQQSPRQVCGRGSCEIQDTSK